MTTPLPPDVADLLKPRCSCGDCESAVSPGAYLATLFDYTLKSVQDGDTPITADFLVSRFHQPFGQLPLDCSAAEQSVSQVRIAVEVLRGYLGPRPLLGAGRESRVSAGEAAYRLAAYTMLLAGAGSSFDEIRLAKSAPEDERAALADRLSVGLTPAVPPAPRNDELDELLRDPEAASGQPTALTEHFLERTFGFAVTDGDPLCSGLKSGDVAGQFTCWRFAGADPGRNTDDKGQVHLSITRQAAGYVVSVFADAGRARLVATGARADSDGPVGLIPVGGSGLSGTVTIAYSADATDTSVAVAPLLLCWRLSALRSRWFSEDWAAAADVVGPDQPAPIVDPDVIGLADMRSTRPGDAAYDLWLARVGELADRRDALAQARVAAADPAAAMDDVVALALSVAGDAVSTVRLTDLAAAERRGESITAGLAALGLSPAAFRFLMPLITLVQQGREIGDPEWSLIFDTLGAARKRRDVGGWRAAEKAAGITLSPNYFRPASADAAPARAHEIDTPVWLSTYEPRRRWVEVLSARIEQESNIVAGVESARKTAEQAALPLLRDTLIDGSDAEGDETSGRAEWLTRRVLVDMRTAGTHDTTRVAQGLETLQELLFRLRSGQFGTDNPQPNLMSAVKAAATTDGRTHLIGYDDQFTLWHRVWDGQWRSWRSRGPLPGAGSSIPPSELGVTARGDGFDVGVIGGGDERLYIRRFAGVWAAWERVPAAGPVLYSGSPGLVAQGTGTLDVFVHRGTDGGIERLHFDGTSWANTDDLGVMSQRSPAAVSSTPNTFDLILAHDAPNLFRPVHLHWDGAAWQSQDLDDLLSSDAALIVFDGGLQLYDNRIGVLRRKVFDGGWQPWENVDAGLAPTDPQLRGTPTACVSAPGTVDVYGIRDDRGNRAVWHRRYSAGMWLSWERMPVEDLQLDNFQFDAEWEWLGSYATFRSAALVRLYPDFLLLPSLAPRQTPAFRSLVSQARPTTPMSPTRARQLAGQYSDYVEDVTKLDVQATCQARTPMTPPAGSSGPSSRVLQFLFGRAFPTGRVYWCTFDPRDDHSGYAQSFWDEVPLAGGDTKAAKFKVRRILGALPWIDDLADRHHIYLFMETEDYSGRKLQRAAFDLNKMEWEPGVQEITGAFPAAYGSQPGTMTNVELVVVQSDSSSEAPRLAVRPYGSDWAYMRPLNHDVSGFVPSAGDWFDFRFPYFGVGTLYAALRTGGVNWLVHREGSTIAATSDIPDPNPLISRPLEMTVADSNPTFLGALPNNDGAIFVFTQQDGDNRYQRTFSRSHNSGKKYYFFQDVGVLTPHSGGSPSFFVTDESTDHTYAHTCSVSTDKIVGKSKLDVVPVMRWMTSIPDGGTVTELQSRRVSVRNVYLNNAAASETILTYLREAYRLVPQQLGLALQGSGEYVAALDWLSTVYDYRARQSDRYIDYGLTLDAQLPPMSTLKWPQGWLLDPLNPHAIARTRRGATVRYAISAVMSCLSASADAQYAADTSESLVLARLQYDTVLQLARMPELYQQRPDCNALIATLSITPGEVVPPEVAAALGAVAEEFTQAPLVIIGGLKDIGAKVSAAKSGLLDWDTVLTHIEAFKKQALMTPAPPVTASSAVASSAKARASAHAALLTDSSVEEVARKVGTLASTMITSEAP
jgi:hypothetical protein